MFVIEADEYDTAFFDKRAKFLLYRPQTLIINNLEFDHADIYPDLAAITRQFHQLVRAMPGNGTLIVPGKDANVDALLKLGCWTPLQRFASSNGTVADWTACEDPPGTLSILHGERRDRSLRLAVVRCAQCRECPGGPARAVSVGVAPAVAIEAIGRFGGVRRRLQRIGDFGGVQLFDDFAHHPTAIRRTLEAVRRRADVRRVIAVFEPRSNSMKLGIYRDTLAAALSAADLAWILRPAGLRWDLDAEFREAPQVRVCADTATIVRELAAAGQPGDAVVVMSNGDFQGIHGQLATALGAAG